jgi:hypothetical protein
MNLSEKLATIQTKFKSKKSRYNSFGKYNFRSAEDILEAAKPFLLELGVSVTVSENLIATDPFPIVESKATITDGTDAIYATAIVGIDLDQKGMQMPQKFGSASSYGKKYSLGNLFLIDDTQDSDAINSHNDKDKPELIGDALDKAKQFISNGGAIETIKKKYNVSKEVELSLTKLK